jgi:outer membrane protein TolC
VRLQDAKLQQLLVDYQNAVLVAQQQVDNGISLYLQSRSQAALLRRSADAARSALKVSIEQYEGGATDFTTVVTSEANLLAAESNAAIATANVSLAAMGIYRALGGGWQIRADSNFVTADTIEQMRARTNWGRLLPPPSEPQPPAPGLPSPDDVGPTVRPPEW